MLHILLLWEKPLSEFGFGLGDTRYGVKFLVLSLLFLVVPFAFCGSFDPNVTSEYPLAKALIQHKTNYQSITYFIPFSIISLGSFILEDIFFWPERTLWCNGSHLNPNDIFLPDPYRQTICRNHPIYSGRYFLRFCCIAL